MSKTQQQKKNFNKRLNKRLNQSLQRAAPIASTSNEIISNLPYFPDDNDSIEPILDNISNSSKNHSDNEAGEPLHICEQSPCRDSISTSTASGIGDLLRDESCHSIGVEKNIDSAFPVYVENIGTKLAKWAVMENIPQSSLGKLLTILRGEPIYQDVLPKDPRTLLKTPSAKCHRPMGLGHYHYFGLAESLNYLCIKYDITVTQNQVFSLAINIDGLPISKSTNTSFWPILCSVKSVPDLKGKVFPIALYCGDSKPDANEFLLDFVNECKDLTSNGLLINSIKCDIFISMLICDTPAKSYILSIKGHSGYYSCTKCTEEGEMMNNVLCFLETENYTLRTDSSFRNRENHEHHTGETLISELPNFDMIKNVPIDYMHNLLLGGTKRFLCNKRYGWIFGKPPHKLRARDVSKISDNLAQLKKYIPCEFGRKTRSINECKRYKATEFRLLLLYTGMLVFKDVLSTRVYNNFMTFSLASIILISDYFSQHEKNISYAHNLMKHFILNSIRIYGPDFISHNIHNCLHLSDCVRLFGSLDNCSAFEFENYLKDLKGMLRKHAQPLPQIVRRILEERNILEPCSLRSDSPWPKLMKQHNQGPLTISCASPQYKKAQCRDYCLNVTKIADRFVKLKDDTILEIKNIATHFNSTVLLGYRYRRQNDFFLKPCASSLFEIQYIDKYDYELGMYNFDSISKKLVVLPYKGRYVSMPLWHL